MSAKKILIAAETPVLPIDRGNRKRIWNLMKLLEQNGCDIDFLYLDTYDDADIKETREWIGEDHFYSIKNKKRSFPVFVKRKIRKVMEILHCQIAFKYFSLDERVSPELDDDLIKDSTEFDTVDEYKADVRKKLEEHAQHHAEHDVEDALMDKVVEKMTAEIPQVMFDNRVNEMMMDLEQRLAPQGITMEMYCKFTGQDTPACGMSIGFERIITILMEAGFKVPRKVGKKAYLYEKGLTPAEFRAMLKKAEAERNEGVCVAVAMMQKNKKFQKEQLAATGVEEFVEFYAGRD